MKRRLLRVLSLAVTAALLLTVGIGAVSAADSPAAGERTVTFGAAVRRTYDGLVLNAVPSGNTVRTGTVSFGLPQPVPAGDCLVLRVRNLSAGQSAMPFKLQLTAAGGATWNVDNWNEPEGDGSYDENALRLGWYFMAYSGTEAEKIPVRHKNIYPAVQFSEGYIFVDYSRYCEAAGVPAPSNIEAVSFAFDTGTNPAEKMELYGIWTADTDGFMFSENGIVKDGSQLTPEAFLTENGTILYDFTQIEHEELPEFLSEAGTDESLYSGRIELYKKEYKDTVSISGGVQGLGIGFQSGAKFTQQSDPDGERYSADPFAYVRVYENSEGFTPGTGLAIKIAGVKPNSAFRIMLYCGDYAFRAGFASSAAAGDRYFTLTHDGGSAAYVQSYYRCIWMTKDSGTLYIPYDEFVQIVNETINGTSYGGAYSKHITQIDRIELSFDTATANSFNRGLALGAIADVNVDTETYNVLTDFQRLDATEDATEAADVNYADVRAGQTVYACSSDAFKDDVFRFYAPTYVEVAVRDDYADAWIGDVKVLENFDLPSQAAGLNPADKTAVLNGFVTAAGNVSALTYSEKEGYAYKGMGVWQIGDYGTQYDPSLNAYCNLTFTPNAFADGWSDWTGARGLTLYVENPDSYLRDFNVEFNMQQSDGKLERWNIQTQGQRIYAYDVNTGEEFAFYSSSTIYVPARFSGWLRIPFSCFGIPSWSYTSPSYGPDGVMDFSDPVVSVMITSLMSRNTGRTLTFDNLGVYYADFGVNSLFGGSGQSIAGCLASEYNGGAL